MLIIIYIKMCILRRKSKMIREDVLAKVEEIVKEFEEVKAMRD